MNKVKRDTNKTIRTTEDIALKAKQAAKREGVNETRIFELGVALVSKLSEEGRLKEALF